MRKMRKKIRKFPDGWVPPGEPKGKVGEAYVLFGFCFLE
jgi:hypothetical protein